MDKQQHSPSMSVLCDEELSAVDGSIGTLADGIAIAYALWDICTGWQIYQPSTPVVYSTISYPSIDMP